MRNMIAVVALIAMIGAGIAVDVRETSWGIPFLAPDPSLKTTDAFYGARGATLIGQESTYQLPPVLTGKMNLNATKSKSMWDDDPWMDNLGGRSSEATVLNLAGAGELSDGQIDRLYGGQIPGEMPWM